VKDDGRFETAAASSDGQILAALRDSSAAFWYHPGRWEACVPRGQPLKSVHALAFCPDGETLITGSEAPYRVLHDSHLMIAYDSQALQSLSATVRLWNVMTGEEQPAVPGPEEMAPPDLVVTSAPEERWRRGARTGACGSGTWRRSGSKGGCSSARRPRRTRTPSMPFAR
jgi:hypothetical protein